MLFKREIHTKTVGYLFGKKNARITFEFRYVIKTTQSITVYLKISIEYLQLITRASKNNCTFSE